MSAVNSGFWQCVLFLLAALPLCASANDDLAQLWSMVLSHEEFVELLSEEQVDKRQICMVTTDLEVAPTGKIDREWEVRESEKHVEGPCILVTDYAIGERKQMLRFTYGDYKVKAKMRRSGPGDPWRKTSFTVKGKGKFVMDKEF